MPLVNADENVTQHPTAMAGAPIGNAQHAAHNARMMELKAQEKSLADMMMMILRTLSQKTVIAISTIYSATFTLLTVGSAFFLWYSALETMTVQQIVGCSIYSLTVLLIEVVRRRNMLNV